MSDAGDVNKDELNEIHANNVSDTVVDYIRVAEQDLSVYTTKQGSPWREKDSKFLEDCMLHETIEDAIRYAESKICTIICTKGDEIIWSGGPSKAKEIFS